MAMVQKELNARRFQTLKREIIFAVSIGILSVLTCRCVLLALSVVVKLNNTPPPPSNKFSILSRSFLLKMSGFPLVLSWLNQQQGRITSPVLLWPQAAARS